MPVTPYCKKKITCFTNFSFKNIRVKIQEKEHYSTGKAQCTGRVNHTVQEQRNKRKLTNELFEYTRPGVYKIFTDLHQMLRIISQKISKKYMNVNSTPSTARVVHLQGCRVHHYLLSCYKGERNTKLHLAFGNTHTCTTVVKIH